MSNYKSFKKKEKSWTWQCLILNHLKKREKLDMAMSNFKSFKKKGKNLKWQCLILYHLKKKGKI